MHPALGIHGYFKRWAKETEGEPLPVAGVRLLCPVLRAARKAGTSKKPYTIRVSPYFLAPYARTTVATILNALALKAEVPGTTREDAVLRMGRENGKTFEKYHKRAEARLAQWTQRAGELLQAAGGLVPLNLAIRPVPEKPLTRLWRDWADIYTRLRQRHDALGGRVGAEGGGDAVMIYVLSGLNPAMGLGP